MCKNYPAEESIRPEPQPHRMTQDGRSSGSNPVQLPAKGRCGSNWATQGLVK